MLRPIFNGFALDRTFYFLWEVVKRKRVSMLTMFSNQMIAIQISQFELTMEKDNNCKIIK